MKCAATFWQLSFCYCNGFCTFFLCISKTQALIFTVNRNLSDLDESHDWWVSKEDTPESVALMSGVCSKVQQP